MKVLQTLGRHAATQQVGVFQYKRGVAGVTIDSTIGQATLTPNTITLTHAEWNMVLSGIESATQRSFRLTASRSGDPPNQDLYTLLSAQVPHPSGRWMWNDSWKAYVCAILEHEGTVDLYAGTLGSGVAAHITLARDIP